jgi:D-arabinose 1-dehydrogenase-like Zn-dependent alcohol dehydrogenase
MTTTLPEKQYAVQLVGPGQLKLNTSKDVVKPGPYQILAKVECVGLCFSDLKLLKQFDQHARKSGVVRGVDESALREMTNYVPGDKPTVPGHEVTCRIVAIGENVKHHKVGERCLVQTDYRDLPTANSNAAFGYNFEGGLQEYVLVDERVVIDKTGERFMIPVPEETSASAIALVEPWACVEDSYVNEERQTVLAGGRLLVVAEPGHAPEGIEQATASGEPRSMTQIEAAKVTELPNESFDDIIYFGANKQTIEILNDKLAPRGIINVVQGGEKIGKPVNVGIGRVHYGMTRWIGTCGSNASDSYRNIPPTGELRPSDKLIIIGAGGPMGQMHVIRSVCANVPGVSVVGTDMDDARIVSIAKKAEPLAKTNGVALRLVNTAKQPVTEKFSYFALMAPVGVLVANAIRDSLDGAIINIFAGIPAPVKQEIDLDAYIERRVYMFGTSGSVIRDMKIVLEKVTSGQLDTNTSVDAVSGMAGATDGIAAVENRTLAGKIIVYPMLHDLGLTPLTELAKRFPTVAAKLSNGQWTKAAEAELLRVAGK